MAAKSRTSWRAVKRHHSYTVDEAARLCRCSRQTVRRWLKSGLPALVERKPALILGGDLIEFLKSRSKPRSRCGPDECYCFKCRAPRKAAGGIADLIPMNPTGGNLRALCDVCGTLMHKRVSYRQQQTLGKILDVSLMER